MVVPASSAWGWANEYCGILLNSGTWCGDGTNHTYDFNSAEYRGSGDVWVCERLLYADTTKQRTPPSCSYNYIVHNYGLTQHTLFEAEVKHESGSKRHTVWGYAIA